MTEEVFVIVREAIYKHEICLITTAGADAARLIANGLAEADFDAHHAFVVYPHVLDKPISISIAKREHRSHRYWSDYTFNEPKPIYAVRKGGKIERSWGEWENKVELPSKDYYPDLRLPNES